MHLHLQLIGGHRGCKSDLGQAGGSAMYREDGEGQGDLKGLQDLHPRDDLLARLSPYRPFRPSGVSVVVLLFTN